MADSVSRDRAGQRTNRTLQYYLEKLELLENSAVASDRQTETFALVIFFFVFVVYSHRRHPKIGKTKYCLNYTLTWALPQHYFFFLLPSLENTFPPANPLNSICQILIYDVVI